MPSQLFNQEKGSTVFDPRQWQGELLPYYTFLNVFQHYVDLDCFVVPLDNPDYWMALNRSRRPLGSVDLQHWHASPQQRPAYNQRAFERARKTLKPYKGTLSGFCDLFVPVASRGTCVAVLVAGPFADHDLGAADIREVWSASAGRADAAFGEDLLYFAKVLLETPVLEGQALAAFERVLTLFASVLVREADPRSAAREMEELLHRVISKRFYHFHWGQRAIRQDRYFQAQWASGNVSEWESREIGIRRVPDRVLAAMPFHGEGRRDPLESLALAARFQRWAQGQALSHPECAAAPLEDYGALFFVSRDPEQGEAQAKLAARDLALEVQVQARRQLGLSVAFGVGPREPKERLYHSYLGALRALHVGMSSGRDLSFFEPSMEALKATDTRALLRLEKELREGMLAGGGASQMPGRESFVQAALVQAGDRPESLRVNFLHLLAGIIEEARARRLLGEETAQGLAEACESSLSKPSNSMDLVRAFHARLDEVGSALDRPQSGERDLRSGRALRYVEENFHRDLKMDEVARLHGFSASAFSREFKRYTGRTFSQVLSDRRLDYARSLLQGTRLSVTQVSSAAGFRSFSYFFHWFKSQTGSSPAEYRKKTGFSTVRGSE